MTLSSLVAPSPVATAPSSHHEWQQKDGYWEIAAPAADEDPGAVDVTEGTRGACNVGMVEVEGKMLSDGAGYSDEVEALQRASCTDWIDRSYPERCARFDRARFVETSGRIPRVPMHFCIDRYEYPNRRGAYPVVMVSWFDAERICVSEGKRLCTEQEWTFACEGEEATPYPYGYERDADACVMDRPWIPYVAAALYSPDSERARAELDRLWQGEPAGARTRCRSAFGVHDSTGNVDEWTTSVVPGERPSVLKGGYWSVVRSGCRASTRSHGETFRFYQIGFRCCSNAPDSPGRSDSGP